MAAPSAPRRASAPSIALRNPKIEAAIDHAIERDDPAELLALLARSSGLPGRRGPDLGPSAPLPRANLDLARATGSAIADRGARSDRLVRALCASAEEYARIVAAQALAARAAHASTPRAALAAMQELAEDP